MSVKKEVTAEEKLLAADSIVLSYILRANLEEMTRAGYLVHRERKHANAYIKFLGYKEHLFHKLDEVIPEHVLDARIESFYRLVKFLVSIDPELYPQALKAFEEGYKVLEKELKS